MEELTANSEATEPVSGEEAEAAKPTRVPSLWHNRDFLILWSGQFVSSLGTGISSITLPLLVLALTGSPAQAGAAGFFFSLPYVILSLPAGALVDRWNRKMVMILCDSGRAVVLLSIPVAWYLFKLTMVQIYIVGLVDGALFTFFNIAEIAALPRVVTKEQLPAANGQNQAGQIAAFMAGPPIGGFIFQTVGKTVPYLFDSVSYVFSVVSLFLIRVEFQAERADAASRNLGAEIKEGLAWLWNQPLIRYMAFLTGGLNFSTAGIDLIMIVLAKHQHAPPWVIGVIFAIASVGGILGSVLGTPIQKRFTFSQVIVTAVWIQALLFPVLAVVPNPFLLGVVGAGMFVTGPIYNVVQVSYRLALIPDELQGRVNSAFRLLAFGFQPLGIALSGVVIQAFGPITAVLVFSGVMILVAVITTFNSDVRRAGKPAATA